MLYCTGMSYPFYNRVIFNASTNSPNLFSTCFLNGTDDETLFNHLQLLQLGIISFIGITLMFDLATRLPENKMQVTLTC